MAIQNARSNTSGNAPSSLQDGQIAVNQADDVLFSRKPDGTVRRTLMPKRYGVADTSFAVRVFDTYIGIASLTAPRVISLPAASAYPAGQPLAIADEAGACSLTNTVTVTAAGLDKVNGAATLALTTAYFGVILISDGSSKWTAAALPAAGAANALLYVQQPITAGQQDQARLNLNGGAAAAPSTTTPLALLDIDRDQYATGTSTLTMPTGVAPGWRSGIVTNDNAVTGLVTLAVPTGHSLDGVLNGTTALFPFQRARLKMASAGMWRTQWVERSPLVATASVLAPVLAIGFSLPVGYSGFRIAMRGVSLSAAGASLGHRLSGTGSSGVRSGSADYTNIAFSTNGTASGPTSGALTYGYLTSNQNDSSGAFPSSVTAFLAPGATGQAANLIAQTFMRDNTPALVSARYDSVYTGASSGAIGRANYIQFVPTTGTITQAYIDIYGEP